MILVKKNSTMPQLAEIIQKLLAKGGPYFEDQERLARDLGTDSPMISKIKYFKPEWEAHFKLFARLLPIAIQYGLIEARHLLPDNNHEPTGNMGTGAPAPAKASRKQRSVR